MKIFLVRHAKPAISSRIFYGQMDVPLSGDGRRQAVMLGEWLKKSGYSFSKFITSDLSRCVETSQIIHDIMGLDVPIETTAKLREVDFGDWTGLTWEQIESRNPGALAQRFADLASFRPPNGESLAEVLERAWSVIVTLFSEMQKDMAEDVLIVAHGGINRLLISRAIGLPLQHIFNLGQDYGCINILERYQDNNMTLMALNLKMAPSMHGIVK